MDLLVCAIGTKLVTMGGGYCGHHSWSMRRFTGLCLRLRLLLRTAHLLSTAIPHKDMSWHSISTDVVDDFSLFWVIYSNAILKWIIFSQQVVIHCIRVLDGVCNELCTSWWLLAHWWWSGGGKSIAWSICVILGKRRTITKCLRWSLINLLGQWIWYTSLSALVQIQWKYLSTTVSLRHLLCEYRTW